MLRSIVLYWLPTIAWAALIFFLSSISYVVSPIPEFKMSDKMAHIIVYGILTLLARRSFGTLSFGQTSLLSVLFASLYGLSDEIHQLFVPGRDGSVADFVADCVGAIGFILLQRFWFLNRGKLSET